MSLICYVKQYAFYNYILEDPDTRYRRIFIENQAFNVHDLSPRFGEFFYHPDTTNNSTLIGSGSADWTDYPYISTQGKSGLSWSNGRQDWPGSIGVWDPWLLVLDYTYPVQRIVRDLESRQVYVFYPRDLTSTNIRQDVWIGENMADPSVTRATTNAYYMLPLYRRTDGYWVALDMDNTALWVTQMRLRPSGINIFTQRNVGSQVIFFVGQGSDNAGYFVEVDGTSSAYNIYKYADYTNTADTIGSSGPSLVLGPVGGSVSNYCLQFPSNITDPSSDRKVFYSSHWDSTFNLAPQRIVFNKTTNEFAATTCTMVYASGTYTNYATIPNSNNYGTGGNNNWWIKPHVFTTASTNYITFCTIEKCIALYPTERWTTSTQRSWVTYSIGTGTNDHILTYHSRVVWPRAEDMPRSWVPTTEAGSQMVVFQTGRTSTLNFNTSTGWQISNIQDLDTRGYGMDSAGRLYCITRGQASATQTGATANSYTVNQQGYNAIWMYDPNIQGNNYSITLPQVANNYTGTVYYTTATLDITFNKQVTNYKDANWSRLNPFSVTNTATGYLSWKFDGTDDRLIVAPSDDWCFRKGDFTIEFWLYSNVAWSSQTDLAGIVGCKVNDASLGWQIARYSSGGTGPWLRMFGTTDFTGSFSVSTQVWEHWALTRSGNTIRWYKNGSPDATTLTVSSEMELFDYNAQLFVGYSQTWGAHFNGYISNLRIVKGLAVYSGLNSFTVPTAPLTARQSAGTNIAAITTQTVLLTCQDTVLPLDNSNKRVSQLVALTLTGSSMTFDDDGVGPYYVQTSSTAVTPVLLKVVGSGTAFISMSGTV